MKLYINKYDSFIIKFIYNKIVLFLVLLGLFMHSYIIYRNYYLDIEVGIAGIIGGLTYIAVYYIKTVWRI